MKLTHIVIYPIENAYIVEARDVNAIGSLKKSFDSKEAIASFIQEHLVPFETVKEKREKEWYSNPTGQVPPNAVDSERGD